MLSFLSEVFVLFARTVHVEDVYWSTSTAFQVLLIICVTMGASYSQLLSIYPTKNSATLIHILRSGFLNPSKVVMHLFFSL